VSNTNGVFFGITTPGGDYPPNAWGLYDMHGNLWEWCLDWFGAYPADAAPDPRGPATGSARALRGGSWFMAGGKCRSASRASGDPKAGRNGIGFRVVLASSQ